MEHWGLFLLLLLVSVVPFVRSYHGENRYNILFIDCGASTDNGLTTWHTDENFIKTGQNSLLISNQNFSTMNTLRFFPRGIKNCYKLPFYASDNKFLIRAGFYYGNYDGLNKPPSFNLELDGSVWTTVTTSTSKDEPMYHEVIYRTRGDSATVCLVRTIYNDVPFISSLEAMIVYDDNYKLMENKTALYLHSRINYGANKSIEKLIGPDDERFNRAWNSKEMAEYLNISMPIIPHGDFLSENKPPWPVMATAIQAKNVSDSIHLSVNFSTQTQVVAYFVLYFMDPLWRFPQNQTSKVEIYIDSRKLDALDVPQYWGRYDHTDPSLVLSFYPVRVFGSANVTISPVQGTALAPILNAMEVFSVIDVSTGQKLLNSSVLALSFIVLHSISILVLLDATELFLYLMEKIVR